MLKFKILGSGLSYIKNPIFFNDFFNHKIFFASLSSTYFYLVFPANINLFYCCINREYLVSNKDNIKSSININLGCDFY